jgi:hypothetical protein
MRVDAFNAHGPESKSLETSANVRERYPRQGKQTLLFLKKKNRAAGATKRLFSSLDQRRSKLPAPAKRSFCAAFFKKRLLA